jgi:bis(5'-nucleosidyl)-tetraphosphatase
MKHEKSCGAVVFRRARGLIEYLLLRHNNGNHWGFPKGHVERGETETQTALREIYEEVGLRVKFIDGFRHVVEYAPQENTWKVVVYFLGQAGEDQVTCQWAEIREYRWVDYQTARELLDFENSKILLQEAAGFLGDLDKDSF